MGIAVGWMVTRRASTAAFTFAASMVSTFSFFVSFLAWGYLMASGLLTNCCTFHAGMRPFSVLSGDDVVTHRVLRITMKPARPVKATRNPSRAPRFVPSSR